MDKYNAILLTDVLLLTVKIGHAFLNHTAFTQGKNMCLTSQFNTQVHVFLSGNVKISHLL